MVDVLQFPLAPWLELSAQALFEVACLELAARKLPAMEADLRPVGLSERQAAARQIRLSLALHAEIWRQLSTSTTIRQLQEAGGVAELTAASGHLVHRVMLRLPGESLVIEGFGFSIAETAPPPFRLYPMVADLSLVRRCPYKPGPRAA